MSSSCKLSASGSAFSAMLSAFVGSVINGLSSGFFVAFMTGWIAWFAFFRVLVGGLYMFYRSATNSWVPEAENDAAPKAQGRSNAGEGFEMMRGDGAQLRPPTMPPAYSRYDNHQDAWEQHDASASLTGQQPFTPAGLRKFSFFSVIWPSTDFIRARRAFTQSVQRQWISGRKSRRPNPWAPLSREVTVLGWFGWIYGALYAPISQALWIAFHMSDDTAGVAKIFKGMSVAVSGLPLCIDSRIRYGDALARKLGDAAWARYAFNLINAVSCIVQAIFCGVLLVTGAVGAYNDAADGTFGTSSFPWPLFAIYPIFSLVWMYGSFALLPVRDGGRMSASQWHWMGYIADVVMGAFAGIFLAAPAFALYQNSSFDEKYMGGGNDGSDLMGYLQCETVGWKLFAATAP